MASKYFDKAAHKISPESKRFTELSFDLVDRIHALLENQNRTQRDLADKMGKQESEISKWLAPGHNFTLKTLIKLEIALGHPVITVSSEGEAQSPIIEAFTHSLGEQEIPYEKKGKASKKMHGSK
ncbi:MAG: helix-turn-helix transcriptional regulator [Phaeodactylibacter sp.]|nr:helix-turn-helix transcriptional regulator [Phaeodactylibacter sp.]